MVFFLNVVVSMCVDHCFIVYINIPRMCVSVCVTLCTVTVLIRGTFFSPAFSVFLLSSRAAQILLSGAQQAAIAVCAILATAIVLVAANR